MKSHSTITILIFFAACVVTALEQSRWSFGQEVSPEEGFVFIFDENNNSLFDFFDLDCNDHVTEMFTGEYEKAISILKNRLKETETVWQFKEEQASSRNGLGYRYMLWTLAKAYEFNRQFDEAYEIYQTLFSEENQIYFKWIRARLEHACGRKRLAFDMICENIESYPEFLNMSTVFEELAMSQSKEENDQKDLLTFGRNAALENQKRNLAFIRERCAEIANPKLHFTYDPFKSYPGIKESILTAKSYRSFLDFMEEEYAAAISGEPGFSHPQEYYLTHVKQLMDLFRKLAELPY